MADKKKIVLVSHADVVGGAAVVTSRLMNAFREAGHQADMLVFAKSGDDPHVRQIGWRWLRGVRFLGERLQIYLRNGRSRKNLFKVSTASMGMSIHRNRLVREADVVILSWINQGTLSLAEIGRLADSGKKIIWIMHDMWCMTGICHHAHDCERYIDGDCGNCPFLKADGRDDDLSRRVWREKQRLYARAGIRFVAVSSWLRDKAMSSSLLENMNVEMIPNAFPADRFQAESRRDGDLPMVRQFRNVIVFGAQRLDDPIKGLEYAVDALNILVDENPEIAAGSVAVFFGNIYNGEIFNKLRFPHLACGTISDPAELHRLYCAADVVLSTSLYETLPGTLIEGQASGAVPVTFGCGGQADIIDHKVNGYIARYLDSRDIARGIKWALEAGIPRERLHQSVVDRFSADVIAARYIDLINREI